MVTPAADETEPFSPKAGLQIVTAPLPALASPLEGTAVNLACPGDNLLGTNLMTLAMLRRLWPSPAPLLSGVEIDCPDVKMKEGLGVWDISISDGFPCVVAVEEVAWVVDVIWMVMLPLDVVLVVADVAEDGGMGMIRIPLPSVEGKALRTVGLGASSMASGGVFEISTDCATASVFSSWPLVEAELPLLCPSSSLLLDDPD